MPFGSRCRFTAKKTRQTSFVHDKRKPFFINNTRFVGGDRCFWVLKMKC